MTVEIKAGEAIPSGHSYFRVTSIALEEHILLHLPQKEQPSGINPALPRVLSKGALLLFWRFLAAGEENILLNTVPIISNIETPDYL